MTVAPTSAGFMCLAAALGAWSRKAAGWPMANRLRAKLVVDALEMAPGQRRPADGAVVHGGQGSQCTPVASGQTLQASGRQAVDRLGRRRLWQRRVRERLPRSNASRSVAAGSCPRLKPAPRVSASSRGDATPSACAPPWAAARPSATSKTCKPNRCRPSPGTGHENGATSTSKAPWQSPICNTRKFGLLFQTLYDTMAATRTGGLRLDPENTDPNRQPRRPHRRRGTRPASAAAWRGWNIHPEGYPNTTALADFAKQVTAKTGGRVTAQVYNNGVLGDQPDAIDQLRNGALAFANFNLGPMGEFVPSVNVLSLPFLFTGVDQMHAVMDGPHRQALLRRPFQAGHRRPRLVRLRSAQLLRHQASDPGARRP